MAELLGSPTWSGGGPGLMQAASLGALEASKPVSGIRMLTEAEIADEATSYLPEHNQVVCKFLSGRKVCVYS